MTASSAAAVETTAHHAGLCFHAMYVPQNLGKQAPILLILLTCSDVLRST
jgi:hypothetical protein